MELSFVNANSARLLPILTPYSIYFDLFSLSLAGKNHLSYVDLLSSGGKPRDKLKREK